MAIFEKRYVFTSNRHSKKGMMAFVFGMISLISFFLAAGISIAEEAKTARMGGAGFFAAIFAFVGVILGLMALQESDVFPLLPRLGFAVSVIAFLLWVGVVYVGILWL